MKAIHIANSKKRDAEVAVEQQVRRSHIRTVLPDGNEKNSVRIIKNTIQHEFDVLLEEYNGDLIGFETALMDNDPEVDMETAGRKLRRTRKLYIDQDNNIAYRINLFQIVYNADGTEIERRDINRLPANINSEIPIKWTSKRFSRDEAIRRFVFSRKYQIRHINGVTFDFLYNMAKELAESQSMMLVGAGSRGLDPILLTRGGQPYRGFLEGRVGNERYALILHLSDIELKGFM